VPGQPGSRLAASRSASPSLATYFRCLVRLFGIVRGSRAPLPLEFLRMTQLRAACGSAEIPARVSPTPRAIRAGTRTRRDEGWRPSVTVRPRDPDADRRICRHGRLVSWQSEHAQIVRFWVTTRILRVMGVQAMYHGAVASHG
jgi:hypothetical protein